MKKSKFILGVVAACATLIAMTMTSCSGLTIRNPYVPKGPSADIEEAMKTGYTVEFTVNKASEASVDWATKIVTTEDNYIITLPNLDPYNNTSDSDLLKAKNKWPAAENLKNGAEWNSAYTGSDVAVKITIDSTNGIQIYLDGTLSYVYDMTTWSEAGMKEFVAAIISGLVDGTATLNSDNLAYITNIKKTVGIN